MGKPLRAPRARTAARVALHSFAFTALQVSMLAAFTEAAIAQAVTTAAVDDTLERIIITGARPTSIPTEIPTTIESITRKQIDETVNATDAEDALKYFPSLIVRKRYIGDYDHAVLGSRASGTGNSARSLVYADGILLSNLLGNGASFTPRWGMVGPEEIERVDVLYGPFSAAYPGNSVGAVVDYVTRMPTETEAHLKLSGFTAHQRNYASDGHFGGGEGRAALGSRSGPIAWWLDASRLDAEAQPITFANRLLTGGTVSTAGTRVTGAVFDQNPRYQNWYILGEGTQTHTTQDHAKVKLSYDLAQDVRATLRVRHVAQRHDPVGIELPARRGRQHRLLRHGQYRRPRVHVAAHRFRTDAHASRPRLARPVVEERDAPDVRLRSVGESLQLSPRPRAHAHRRGRVGVDTGCGHPHRQQEHRLD